MGRNPVAIGRSRGVDQGLGETHQTRFVTSGHLGQEGPRRFPEPREQVRNRRAEIPVLEDLDQSDDVGVMRPLVHQARPAGLGVDLSLARHQGRQTRADPGQRPAKGLAFHVRGAMEDHHPFVTHHEATAR